MQNIGGKEMKQAYMKKSDVVVDFKKYPFEIENP